MLHSAQELLKIAAGNRNKPRACITSSKMSNRTRPACRRMQFPPLSDSWWCRVYATGRPAPRSSTFRENRLGFGMKLIGMANTLVIVVLVFAVMLLGLNVWFLVVTVPCCLRSASHAFLHWGRPGWSRYRGHSQEHTS